MVVWIVMEHRMDEEGNVVESTALAAFANYEIALKHKKQYELEDEEAVSKCFYDPAEYEIQKLTVIEH